MTALTLTKTNMQTGIWQGLLSAQSEAPELSVTHLDREVPDVTIVATEKDDTWLLQVPIPAEAISDGVNTLLIRDAVTGETLESITLMAGEALGADLRAEVDLLRAELDMLKRAFRRHCVESE
ncbi:MAG: hypothetical protein AAF665_10910 [Pseudomonadota bacterium]